MTKTEISYMLTDAKRRLDMINDPIRQALGQPAHTPTEVRLKAAWEALYEAFMKVEQVVHDASTPGCSEPHH